MCDMRNYGRLILIHLFAAAATIAAPDAMRAKGGIGPGYAPRAAFDTAQLTTILPAIAATLIPFPEALFTVHSMI
jgi:hypothetical protein